MDKLLFIFLALTLAACGTTGTNGEAKGQGDVPALQESVEAEDDDEDDIEDEMSDKVAHRGTKKMSLEKKYNQFSAAIKSGRDSEISKAGAALLSDNENDVIVLNGLAMHHAAKGRYTMAKTILNRAMKVNGKSPALHNNLGVILYKEGLTVEAVVSYKKALSYDRGFIPASMNLGSYYAKHQDYKRALPLLARAYRNHRQDFGLANAYAVTLKGTANYTKAQKIYEEIIRKDTENLHAHLNYAILLIDHLKMADKGMKLINKLKFMDGDADAIGIINRLEAKAKRMKK